MVTLILFWVSIAFVLYSYLGYPFYLYILSRLRSKPILKQDSVQYPSVSVVIAAKNEAKIIEQRVMNLLEQSYPSDKLEIIVVSDGSTDGTDSIVASLAGKQLPGQTAIICHTCSSPHGKPTALNIGVQRASGEIIVFTDSRQRFEKETVLELVKNFSDALVGVVSGELLFMKNCESDIKTQMGAYWRYEKQVRKLESATGSVIGVTGAVYAIRKSLYRPLPPSTLLDDVLTPMTIAMQGYRVVFDSQAVAYDTVSKNIHHEWKRKVRTLAGNWQLLSLSPNLLNPFVNSQCFRFVSHKITRILVPFFLLVIFVLSVALQKSIFFKIILFAQIFFYVCALLVRLLPRLQENSFLNFVYFFCVLNAACLVGFWGWVRGHEGKTWSKPI